MKELALFVLITGVCGLTLVFIINERSPLEEPHSPIVATVEEAGAGSLRGVDERHVTAWLVSHREVANSVARQCAVHRTSATAAWGNTTEGRVCAAVSFVAYEPLPEHGNPMFTAVK